MKTRLFILAMATSFALVSCDLNQEPGGSTITENQYQEMDNVVEGTVKGVYSLLYAYGGDHDSFGQRSLDLYGDLCCGDVAMNSQRYGWFVTDEYGRTYQRSGSFWSFYYQIIRACNKGINGLSSQGIPALDADLTNLSEQEYLNGFYYAELLTMRGWAYAALQRYFCRTYNEIDINTELSVPVYTDADTKADTTLGAPRATAVDVYLRVEEDLKTAIQYFEAFNEVERSTKIEANVDVARMTLAYSYLNKGENAKALEIAEDLIETTTAELLSNKEVLTTGFNEVNHKNWIWGQDVTIETTTGLASFFGQCDIYSYSYASAGDIKGIDKKLYDEILALKWDVRELWWGKYYRIDTKKNADFQYAPDGKFYSAASTKLQGDRDWLSDNIFMRLEPAYLIAAEAAWRTGDNATALNFLDKITSERVKEGSETLYADYKATLAADAEALGQAIRYNWRVELWGEGFGLQTFRRWGETVKLGDNHLRSNKELVPSTPRLFTFEIPTSETMYNPFIRSTTEMAVDNN